MARIITKDLGQCPWSRAAFIACMREKGGLPPDDDDAEDEAPEPEQ